MVSPNESHLGLDGQDESSRDGSAESSAPPSRGGSRPLKEKHRVRFTPGGESLDSDNKRTPFDVRDDSNAPPKPLPRPRALQHHGRSSSASSIPLGPSPPRSEGASPKSPSPNLRPSIMRHPSSASESEDDEPLTMGGVRARKEEAKQGKKKDDQNEKDGEDDDDEEEETIAEAAGKAFSQQSAQQRAARLSRMVGNRSAPGSRATSPVKTFIRNKSPVRSPPPSPPLDRRAPQLNLNDLPLEKLESRRNYGIEDETDEEEEKDGKSRGKKRDNRFYTAARRLVKYHTRNDKSNLLRVRAMSPPLRSGQVTPKYERDPDDYVPRPKEYREGYLASLLKLYNEQGVGSALAHIPSGYEAINRTHQSPSAQSLLESTPSTPAQTPAASPESSGTNTPKSGLSPPKSGVATPKTRHQKWYYKNPEPRSTGSIADLVSQSTMLAQPGGSQLGQKNGSPQTSAIQPKPKHRPRSSQALDHVFGRKKKGSRGEDEIRIQVHIAETIQRQGYLLKICRCLMAYGAPTHRLEGDDHLKPL